MNEEQLNLNFNKGAKKMYLKDKNKNSVEFAKSRGLDALEYIQDSYYYENRHNFEVSKKYFYAWKEQDSFRELIFVNNFSIKGNRVKCLIVENYHFSDEQFYLFETSYNHFKKIVKEIKSRYPYQKRCLIIPKETFEELKTEINFNPVNYHGGLFMLRAYAKRRQIYEESSKTLRENLLNFYEDYFFSQK